MQLDRSDAPHYRLMYHTYCLMDVIVVIRCLPNSTRVGLTLLSCPFEGPCQTVFHSVAMTKNTAQSMMTLFYVWFLVIKGQKKWGFCQLWGLNNIETEFLKLASTHLRRFINIHYVLVSMNGAVIHYATVLVIYKIMFSSEQNSYLSMTVRATHHYWFQFSTTD